MRTLARLAPALCLLSLACSSSSDATAASDAASAGTPDVPRVDADEVPDTAGEDATTPAPTDVAEDAVAAPDGEGSPDDVPVVPPSVCDTLGLPAAPWVDGPYGQHRHDLVDDFTVATVGGGSFSLKDARNGCESVIVIPDTLAVSEIEPESVWFSELDALLKASPRNVHYLFVSRQSGAQAEATAIQMYGYVIGVLDPLDAETQAHWKAHLHVASAAAADLGNWLTPVLTNGVGQLGFGVDPSQHLRGVGSLADVNHYYPSAPEGSWPWGGSLAFAANEALHWNVEARRDADFATLDVVTVPLWTGEVISEFDERPVELPPGVATGEFDGLYVEIDQRCPNPALPEVGNCGAWDYISWLFVYDGDADAVVKEGESPTARRELVRGITTYHREGRWRVDATPMLAWLQGPQKRLFRWEWAPSWNTQPTETRVSLHFVRRGSGSHPTRITPLFSGGSFGSAYNVGREPITVAVPPGAKRVELVATITGHGSGTSQCAEFCNHVHEFTVDGQTFTQSHPSVGNSLGCAAQIDDGVVPNQWGTWWFGRGGWCPGNMVTPLRADVTALAADGEVTVSYRGLLNGAEPPDGAGDIVMSSQLVVWE